MIQLNNLTKIYNAGMTNEVRAIDIPKMTISDKEFVCILGKSGSGKTTLLNLIGGLDRPDSGEIIIDGTDISKEKEKNLALFRRAHIGYVFQSYNLVRELTGEENILYPAYLTGRKTDRDYYNYLVDLLGIKDRLQHLPHQMSGGQQQRIAIARALINKPGLILCDEPTGNLDSSSAEDVRLLLNKIHQVYEPTVIVVTHNSDFIIDSTRIITICDGKIAGLNK